MRLSAALVSAILVATAVNAPAAPPKKAAPAAAHGKGRPAHPAAPAAPASAAPEEEAPYGAEAAPATSGSASAPAETSPTSSGDSKLDEPPPPQTKATEGPKPSPLTPEKNELPNATAPPAPVQLDKLMADIATLRARVAALATSLFSSKLRVYVRTEGDDAHVETFVVTLDDGVVFRSDPGFLAEDEKVVYDHALAPGSHVVGLEIERKDTRGPAFRTWQTSRFAIQVPERQTLEAIVVIVDKSDMADDFPDDHDGQYDLRIKLRAKVVK
jgi:hypothetical protein